MTGSINSKIMEEQLNDSPIYWSLFEYEDWKMYIAATLKGLCYVGSHDKPYQELEEWVCRRFTTKSLQQNDEILQPYTVEITEYLQGTRKRFSLPFDLHGTPFQLAVWEALEEIPYGKTTSYSDLANTIQKPKAVRAVGTAIGANPILISVPCHRVLGKNGTLTGYRGGLDMKKKLLQIEQQLL